MTKKNKTTQKIRAVSQAIIVEIGRGGKQSVRQLAQLIKGAKSSYIATSNRKSDANGILNRLLGRPKRAAPG